MQLVFIRHGKPKVIDGNFYQARLSDESYARARQLALSGSLIRPDRVFSSPYNRAMDTARALCEVYRIDFEVKAFLGEWHLQSLNLLDPEYTLETEKGWADHSVRVLGGESLDDLRKRVYDGTVEVASSSAADALFFVCHGTLMEMLCSRIKGRPAEKSNVEKMKFLEYALIEFKDGVLSLTRDIHSP